MNRVLLVGVIMAVTAPLVLAQSNKIVFGPLVGDDAGVLTANNGLLNLELEVWVRTDPDIPVPFWRATHALMTDDAIILNRNGHTWDQDYDVPNWYEVWLDGPYVYDPADNFPIPEGFTTEIMRAIYTYDIPGEEGDPLDTNGEWDYYGSFWMDVNTGIVNDETYSPFSRGWYPSTVQSTRWYYQSPPGGSIVPEQDYCGLYFEPDTCIYIPGDVNRNGVPLELSDISAMIASYRGLVEPYYLCECSEDPPIFDFAATADPNGNCVANELSDVMVEIAAYRGHTTASGCPDCPGSEGLAIRESEGQ